MDIASLIYDVSKDLYAFYQKANSRDDDIKDLRAQLLWMGEKSVLVQEVLQREGAKAEDKSNIEHNLRSCRDATTELATTVAKLKTVDQSSQRTFAKITSRVSALGLKTAWPFKKETIAALAGYARTCHSALDAAISILHLNVSVSHIEKIQNLDATIVAGRTSIDNALRDMKTVFQDQLHEISQRLVQQTEQLAQQTRLLTRAQDQAKAQEIIESLKFAEMNHRVQQITNAKDETYAWLFTPEAQDKPEVQHLVRFLTEDSGLFWILGDAASGKSTLMKYIASPQRGDSTLWQWQGHKEVTIACHFCWIAGSPMLKTQLALLQTLLYYILRTEPGIVPNIPQLGWGAAHGDGPWSVRQLQGYLNAAVNASERRLCLFIDGLDEIQPESDHEEVVEFLKQLATFGHVKIIVSSRPWSVFRGHCSREYTLHMRSVNIKAIIGHLEKTLGSLPEFLDVSWHCQHERLRCEHSTDQNYISNAHGDAHALVRDFVSRSDGNFLWLTLVTNTILRLSKMGIGLAEIRKEFDDLPDDLDTYFRKMIIGRGDKRTMRITAMALSIALLPRVGSSWISFWLLINYINGNAPSLEQPKFALTAPYHMCDRRTFMDMMQKTETFVSESCRDLLDTSELQDIIHKANDNAGWRIVAYGVNFAHRTMYDFLRTREMQELLDRHKPQAFHRKDFWLKLAIAGAKVQPKARTDVQVTSNRRRDFREDGTAKLLWEVSYDLRRTEPQALGEQSQGRELTLSQLVEELENVALHDFIESSRGHYPSQETLDPDSGPHRWTTVLCGSLATFGRYRLLDAILERWPDYVLDDDGDLFDGVLALVGVFDPAKYIFYNPALNTEFLRKLFVAGADPNRRRKLVNPSYWARHTVWCDFLRQVVANEKSMAASASDHNTMNNPRPGWPMTFSSPDVQVAIKCFLEFGAELELTLDSEDEMLPEKRIHPLDTLRTYLPMGADSEWPSLLELYMQPKKREEIRAARLEILDSIQKKTWAFL